MDAIIEPITQLDDAALLARLLDGGLAERIRTLLGLDFFPVFTPPPWPSADGWDGARAMANILLENFSNYVRYGIRAAAAEFGALHSKTWQALSSGALPAEEWGRFLAILIGQMRGTCQQALVEGLLAFTHNAKNYVEDVLAPAARRAQTAEEKAACLEALKEFVSAFDRLLRRRGVGSEIVVDLRPHLRRGLEVPLVGGSVPRPNYQVRLPEDGPPRVSTREGMPRDALMMLINEIGYNCSAALRKLPEADRRLHVSVEQGAHDESDFWVLTVENRCHHDGNGEEARASYGRACMRYFAKLVGAGVGREGYVEFPAAAAPGWFATRVCLPRGYVGGEAEGVPPVES